MSVVFFGFYREQTTVIARSVIPVATLAFMVLGDAGIAHDSTISEVDFAALHLLESFIPKSLNQIKNLSIPRNVRNQEFVAEPLLFGLHGFIRHSESWAQRIFLYVGNSPADVYDFQKIDSGSLLGKTNVHPSPLNISQCIGTSFSSPSTFSSLYYRISKMRSLAPHAKGLTGDMSSLLAHDTSLSFYGSQGSICGANACDAHYNQDCPKSPTRLVHPVSR